MEAQALHEIAHIANQQLILTVPSWMNNQDVEVIVLPKMQLEKPTPQTKRTPNLLASKGAYKISDDFDEELSDSFWLGENE